MGNEDATSVEKRSAEPAREAEWHVPQHAHRDTRRSQQTATQKPGVACVNRSKAQPSLTIVEERALMAVDSP